MRKKLKQEGLKIGSRLRRLYIAGRREYVCSQNNCLEWCHADKNFLRRPFSVSIYYKGWRGCDVAEEGARWASRHLLAVIMQNFLQSASLQNKTAGMRN